MPDHIDFAYLDDQGRLVLPDGFARRLGLAPGERVAVRLGPDGATLQPGTARPRRVNLEPTSICNLDCATCMRNVWDEPLGRMSAETFEHALAGIIAFDPLPEVFLGGYGEPLSHPDILSMVHRLKQAGAAVELITNGTLLNEASASALVSMGLDRLWVSIDGATPESYSDVRLGAALPNVIANLERLQQVKASAGASRPRLGIAFVAMRRNLPDLPAVVRLGKRLGADRFSVSSVLAHTPGLRDQSLHERALDTSPLVDAPWKAVVDLPLMDLDGDTLPVLEQLLRQDVAFSLNGEPVRAKTSACPFIERGTVSVRWDGAVSPCLPLMHSYASYLDSRERRSDAFTVGNLADQTLPEIWASPAYTALRERVRAFDFSPCAVCNACENASANREDCFGNLHPACGGCLWAQGLIQCP